MRMYPARLISNKEVVETIEKSCCPNCTLLRRTDSKSFLTRGGGIDTGLISSGQLFDLSVNVYLCDLHNFSDQDPQDVLYVVSGDLDTPFNPDATTPKADDIKFDHHPDDLIIFFKKEELESFVGNYPMNKGQKNMTSHNCDLKSTYDPRTLNPFHFELYLFGDHQGSRERLTDKKNGVNKQAAKHLRNQIIEKELVYEFK